MKKWFGLSFLLVAALLLLGQTPLPQQFPVYVGSLPLSGTLLGNEQFYLLQNNQSRRVTVNSLLAALPAGVQQNILNTQTANYTVQTSDCGHVIQAGTGTSGFFNINLPATSGLPSTCAITVKNGDTGRGKLLTGFPSDLNTILWPLQVVQVGVAGASWQTLVNPGRWRLPSNVTFFLDGTNGIDTNDGLAAGAGNAIQSFAQFNTLVSNQLETQAKTITASLAAGQTWTASNVFLQITGGGVVVLNGNGDTLTATGAGASALFVNVIPAYGAFGNVSFTFQNMTITCSGSASGLFVQSGTVSNGASVTFGACPTGAQVLVDTGLSRFLLAANYTISGGAAWHLRALGGGLVDFNSSSFTATLTGTPAYSQAFADAELNSLIFSQNVWSGAATGTRYTAITGSTIGTNCGGANFFPGNAAGLIQQGGHYDCPGTPTVQAASCGTTPGTPTGTDLSGFVQEGTTATGCVLNFATTNAPSACVVGYSTTTVGDIAASVTATQLTASHSNSTSGAFLLWSCPSRVN